MRSYIKDTKARQTISTSASKVEVSASYINDRKVPQILSISASRVEEWSSHSWKWLSRLRVAILKRVKIKKRHSCRTMRIEQREAISALLKVMLSHLDLKTMQVGVYNPETDVFAHLSLNYLAHKANLSIRRTQRAMSWLYDSGYIIGFRQSSYDLETDEYIHKPSIRKISNSLLSDLGITDFAFQRARSKSRKNFQKIVIKSFTDTVVTPAITTINTVKDMISSIITNKSPSKNLINPDPSSTYTEKIKKLMTIMPNLSFSEAERMLPSPNSYK
jgi:hypothetical protein